MATIKDVAREAGVSTATVSRVLNKSGYMSEEAVNKVNKAMETLSYHPNAVARSLVRGKHNSIGVMFPYLSIPFWAELESELEQVAERKGYSLMLAVAPNDAEAYIEKFESMRVQTLRLCQGLGLGGEWGGAVLMTYEYASKRERAFYASIPQMGLATGLCLSSGVVALLSWGLTNEQFMAWGWRCAFLLSVVLVGVALYIRMHILETPDFRKAQERGKTEHKSLPIVRVCKEHPGNIALGVGARWIDGVFFNVLAVFVITYLVQYVDVPRTEALTVVMIAALVMCPFILFAGRLADRFGRGKVYGLASLLCGLSIFPSFWLMEGSGGNLFLIGLAIVIPLSVFYAGVFGPEAALFSDLFPPDVRYTGISIVYQFPGFLVAGIVPGLCTLFMKWNDGDPLYVCLFTLLAGLTSAASAFIIQRKHNAAVRRSVDGEVEHV